MQGVLNMTVLQFKYKILKLKMLHQELMHVDELSWLTDKSYEANNVWMESMLINPQNYMNADNMTKCNELYETLTRIKQWRKNMPSTQ